MKESYLKYLPLGVFSLALGKLLVVSPTWESAAVALVAGLVAAAFELKSVDKQVEAFETKHSEKLKALEAKVEVMTAVINNHAKAYEDMKTHVSGLNLARNLKSSVQTPIEKIF